mgnify:CR=1 FL=1
MEVYCEMSKATVRNTVRAAVIMGAALAAPCFYARRYPEEICQQRLTGARRAGGERLFNARLRRLAYGKKRVVACCILKKEARGGYSAVCYGGIGQWKSLGKERIT